MAYRWDFFVECLSAMLAQATGLMVIFIIFSRTQSLGEWGRWEVIFIYSMGMMAQAIFGAVSHSFWMFASRYIMNGEMDRMLTRPVNPLLQIIIENFQIEVFVNIITAVILLMISAQRLGLHLGPLQVLMLCGLVLSSGMILIGVFLFLITLSFWFEDRVGIIPPVYNLMAFGRYPLTLFHTSIQLILTYVIPFGFMAFYPATAFLQGHQLAGEFHVFAMMTPVVAILVFGFAYAFWCFGLKRYRSTGS